MLLGYKELGLGVGLWGEVKELKKGDLCIVINNRFVLIFFSRVQRVQRRVTLAS